MVERDSEPLVATVLGDERTVVMRPLLDELSAQELTVWQDERQVWRWAWAATALRSEQGFWALGEAIVDAVAARYPETFDAYALQEAP